jgi:NAD(P)-dependent dehydrogenase (short-subunit alcohol dehydrogenase family)
MTDELFTVENKRVFVTGGGSGIGRMIVDGLCERGARIFTVSRKQQVLDELVEELGRERGFFIGAEAVDLSSEEGVTRASEAAGEYFGGTIDILINNSGATWGAPLDEYPMKGWNRVFDLNVRALFHLSQKCLPMLRKAATADDPARIINIGSISGIEHPSEDNAWAYHPSKAAVHHLTQTMAKALASEHITVNAIAPGLFYSRMTDFLMPGGDDSGLVGIIPLGRTGRPSDMVGTVLYLASRAGAFTTGAIVVVDGGGAL